jgi:hypothetical protein
MKTNHDYLHTVIEWFASDFMRHSETALLMLVTGINMIYDGMWLRWMR